MHTHIYAHKHFQWPNSSKRAFSMAVCEIAAAQTHKLYRNRIEPNWAHNGSRTNCISHYYFWLFLLCPFTIISVLLLLFFIAPIPTCVYLYLYVSLGPKDLLAKYISEGATRKAALTFGLFLSTIPTAYLPLALCLASCGLSRLHFI